MDNPTKEELEKYLLDRIDACDNRVGMDMITLNEHRQKLLKKVKQGSDTMWLENDITHIKNTEKMIKDIMIERRTLLGILKFVNEEKWKEYVDALREKDD